ncbi:MAG: ribulose-phosphate 3-epimerase [Erysipelotrichaceae bacterium]|jgi:ribulose-phosphate 3-epimerase|nr:ribulose-phosphate 3-epimerase [Bacillota bacterium]MDY0118430.1 ribulose-phosphate 3-epimerase [Bacilli bacterium]NLJ32277.1 ribulose-phosphate 3-epimerase [Erysipelotrichaceae bacterium]
MRRVHVAPSILSADFRFLNHEIEKVYEAGATYLHFDVMDGHFVPNISFGLPVLESLKGHYNMIYDVHIMISDPLTYGPKFVKAGADIVTFHYEALSNDKERNKVIRAIRKAGGKVGMSIKPKTRVEVVFPFLKMLDLVLVMSVEPGFGGQKFIPASLDKIEKLRKYIDRYKLDTLIEVDGGINNKTAKLCKEKGVDILVAGSYLFGSSKIKDRVEGLMHD